jgi:hypothetical protein
VRKHLITTTPQNLAITAILRDSTASFLVRWLGWMGGSAADVVWLLQHPGTNSAFQHQSMITISLTRLTQQPHVKTPNTAIKSIKYNSTT